MRFLHGDTLRQSIYRAPQQQGNTGGLPCSPRWGSEGTQTVAVDSEYLVTSRARASRQQISGGRGRSADGSSNSGSTPVRRPRSLRASKQSLSLALGEHDSRRTLSISFIG